MSPSGGGASGHRAYASPDTWNIPRLSLAVLPTPLHEAARLREALGGPTRCPRLFFKRDDLTGFGLGGNKARKLEFLVADALAQGATTLITTGGVQSNHARMTAAAACAAGLDCVLVLTTTVPEPVAEGNLLLDHVFGATIHYVPSTDARLAVGDDAPVVARVVAEQAACGRHAYVIPVGGSSGVGALGYVAGSLELVAQLQARDLRPVRVYYASGSRGTQAGLTLGAKIARAEYALHGVAVSGGEAEKLERALRVATEAAERLGADERVAREEFFTDQEHVGEGYGIPTGPALEAIALVARHEGILLDPCYTGKAMAALISHVRQGVLAASDTVVFLHTGGWPAVFTRHYAGLALGHPVA
ncbi:MAG: D-cysteine desulfhydrase family protein [Acidobacteriota bacterium]